MVLSAEEFIRRVLMHVLPRGFTKIRHFGILAPRSKRRLLKICRKLTWTLTAKVEGVLDTQSLLARIFGTDWNICPVCGAGNLQRASTHCHN